MRKPLQVKSSFDILYKVTRILSALKFIYSEKATKFGEISTVDLSYCSNGQIYCGDFAQFCDLLRIY